MSGNSYYIHAPHAAGETVTAQLDGQTPVSKANYGSPVEAEVLYATAGEARMNVIPFTLETVSTGRISPRDDGNTSLSLIGIDPAITEIDATDVDGRPIKIEVLRKRQALGWGNGRGWMFPVDRATGRPKIKKGRFGRKYYFTLGAHGYTKAMIAAEAGVSLSTVTDSYVNNSPIWGRAPETALYLPEFLSLWGNNTHNESASTAANMFESNWLGLECGDYDYKSIKWPGNRGPISRVISGESALHPVLIFSWGEGKQPNLGTISANFQNTDNATWVAFVGVDFEEYNTVSGLDVLISNSVSHKAGFYPQGPGHKTLHNFAAYDSRHDVPGGGRNYWKPLGDHKSGVYTNGLQTSLLALDGYTDKNGWVEGFSLTSLLLVDGPMPPSQYSHNWYLQSGNGNIIIRRLITSRAASQGIQNRPAGTFEDVWFLDNPLAGNQIGYGGENGPPMPAGGGNSGYYSLTHDIVVTSGAAYPKIAGVPAGGMMWGIDFQGSDGTIKRAIFMHSMNLDDPDEVAYKSGKQGPALLAPNNLSVLERGYKVEVYSHNWHPNDDNAAALGKDLALLNAATPQNFAAQRMGVGSASIRDLCLWMRDRTFLERQQDLSEALKYFRTAWGLYIPKRINPVECVFIPNPTCSGELAADRLNWSSGDLPGTVAGDTIKQRGAFVRYAEDLDIDTPDLDGEGGYAEFSAGSMKAGVLRNYKWVHIDLSGQLEAETVTNVELFRATSGLTHIKGAVTDADLIASGRSPEVILGPNWTISNGKVMDLSVGRQGGVGWDGTGTATLTGEAGGKIIFRYFALAHSNRMSCLERFKIDGDAADPTVAATFTMAAGFIVELDLTGFTGTPGDKVYLTGTGVTVVNNGATLPANVAVESGRLVYTVPT